MENDNNRDYGQESHNSQNEKEKLGNARLNIDSERRIENLPDDATANRYENKKEDDIANASGKESSYHSPEDERAFNTNDTEKYITAENPDSKETYGGLREPNRTPGL